jgi:peptidoglycan hydrolase CwlO-like protein
MANITQKSMVPLGTVVAAVLLSVAATRTMDSRHSAGEVNAARVEERIKHMDEQADRTEGKVDELREDMSLIKERLGIVEAGRKR